LRAGDLRILYNVEEDDSLIDELLASDPGFRSLVAKSKAGGRKPFSKGSV